jgi:hypothetical protein
MTAQRAGVTQWKTTTVLIRTDIYSRALDENIDISSECNRALADRLGIDYRQQKIPVEDAVKPVIVAKEPPVRAGEHGGLGRDAPLRPVLNAEDPATPVRLKKMQRVPTVRKAPAAPAVREEEKAEVKKPEHQAPAPARHRPEKEMKKPVLKKGKDNTIREFLSKKIERTEASGGTADRIAKDEMYQLFLRHARTRTGEPVMDKKAFSIALKNRFVLDEATVDGVSYWNNVKLK